jgi:hypothetical protein
MWIWAWEFLRRNDQYRNFWKTKIEPFLNDEGGIAHIGRNSAGEIWPFLAELRTQFGVENPSPPWSATPSHFCCAGIRYTDNMFKRPQTIELEDHELAFFIDLRWPLKSQFAKASRVAERKQVNAKRGARKSNRYPLYLRILDAECSGAPRNLIEQTLFPKMENVFPQNRRTKTFENHRAEARRLCSSGYLALALN